MNRIQEADAEREETSQHEKKDSSLGQNFVEKIQMQQEQIQGIIGDEDATSWQ